MESLRANYRDDEEEDDSSNNNGVGLLNQNPPQPQPVSETATETTIFTENNLENSSPKHQIKQEPDISEEITEGELSEDDNNDETQNQKQQLSSEKPTTTVSDDEEDENTPKKKQKTLASFTSDQTPPYQTTPIALEEEEEEESKKSLEKIPPTTTLKKPKKKANNVWTKPTSRKGKKKNKSNNGNGNGNNSNNGHQHNVASSAAEETVLITPIPRFPDRTDDSPDMKICLSKVYKAEKVELSDDRLSAGSSKGYRMVRATRGVVEGAWFFEIRVSKLGETGHTRLGWSTEKGDLQAPVGYDGNSFGYRDVDGSKVHKAVREKYGEEGYVEGDVIGCYINLPEGGSYAPKPVQLFWYKGQKYSSTLDAKEESSKVVPGSEICFFKNGIFQGVAFKDLCGGRYYPAASMYTLPNQPNCVVKFNFGPDFECFPQDFEDRPTPTPMIEVPYQGFDGRVENSESIEKKQ